MTPLTLQETSVILGIMAGCITVIVIALINIYDTIKDHSKIHNLLVKQIGAWRIDSVNDDFKMAEITEDRIIAKLVKEYKLKKKKGE